MTVYGIHARIEARWPTPAAHRFLVLFFAPALSIRYTLVFGSAAVGLMAAVVISVVALIRCDTGRCR